MYKPRRLSRFRLAINLMHFGLEEGLTLQKALRKVMRAHFRVFNSIKIRRL